MEPISILKAIDGVLQNIFVRWMLLGFCIALTIAALQYKTRLGLCELQLGSAKGQADTYRTHLEHQNAEILKGNEEYKVREAKMSAAKQEAQRIADELTKRGPITLTGDCDNMVSQVLNEVRK